MLTTGIRTLVALCAFGVAGGAWAHGPDLDANVDYTGHKLVEVVLNTPADLERMLQISPHMMSCSLQLGKAPFRITPEQMPALLASGFEFRVIHEDLEAVVAAERERLSRQTAGDPFFDDFRNLATVDAYVNTLVGLRPDLAQRINSIGTSIEGRPIFGLRITGPNAPPDRKAVLFHGCQHAREWISVSTVMYIADQLIRNYDTDPQVQAALDSTVFYIFPVVNPDGYVYTWGPNRYWRRNRRDNGGGSFGVDNNRNWGYQWGGQGSSGDPDSETYRGPAPFSEPETQALRDFCIAHPELVAHIDFHSFAELVMTPWAYTNASPPEPDFTVQLEADRRIVEAMINSGGHAYDYGPVGQVLYLAAGGSIDWTYGDQDMIGITIELRGNDFVISPTEILPTGQENLAGILALVEYLDLGLLFTLPSPLPTVVAPDVPAPVQVQIRPVSTDLFGSGALRYRIGGNGAFSQSALAPLGNFTFQGNLPATPCGEEIQFYFQGLGADGKTYTYPADAPAAFFVADVLESSELFSDTMETNLGWVVGSAQDDATSGIWNRMNPQGTPAQPEDDHTPPPGVNCWVTDGNAGGTIGANDVDGGQTTVTSPVLALGSAPEARIGYWRWYSNDEGAAPGADVFVVDITSNGTTWVNVETVGPTGPEASGGWFYHEFRVADLVPVTNNVRVRFIASDEGSGSIVEAAIDDFRIVTYGCSQQPCPADLDGDDTIGQGDLGILLSDFGCTDGVGNCPGDVDNDGDTDQGDLGILLAAFGTPCP